ncbi:hypothetical protein CSC34_6711 [Pseudomonas aeruginosa]|nr:hypothetical protein CSC34_6711 [Pseudomonas aeruginosa]
MLEDAAGGGNLWPGASGRTAFPASLFEHKGADLLSLL